MKTPVDLPGYSECDIRPDGGYVAALHRGTSVRTHLDVDVPCGYTVAGGWVAHAPRYPRCPVAGPFKVAVQGNGKTLEWEGRPDWRTHRESCGGGGPVIYDASGALRIADCAKVGSQGYRYVAPDGTLVTGDQSRVRAGLELLESTDLGDGIYPGQGPQGGFWVQMPDGYREIAPGIAMVIRATRVGDDLAFCWYEPDVPHRGSATAHFRWMTVDELRALPVKATSLPPVTYAPVVPIGRPLWMGFFQFTPTDTLPDNCRVDVDRSNQFLYVSADDPLFAYVAGNPDGDVAAIERAIAEFREFEPDGPPVLAYVPRGAQHALPTSADIQGVEAYLGATETDAEFMARIAASLRRCPRAALIAQCYTSNTTLTSDLRRLPGLISQLARDHSNVEAILVFSGSGRATGWQDHPEVHAAWQLVFDGITGTPAVEQPAPEPVEPVEPTPEPEPPPAPEPPRPPTMEQPPYTPPVAYRPDTPIGGNAIADFFRALAKINFRKLFRRRAPKPQLPLPNPEVPPEPPVVVTPTPKPIHRPPVLWPHVGLSHYLGLGDPDFDWPRFLDFSKANHVGYHRTWLIDAWATKDIGGLYDGFLPCRRRSDGRFDLFDWRADYFARLRTVTDQSNDRGLFPLWTLLELYSWSDRKRHATVPEAARNLFRHNVNGISWSPDDKVFGVEELGFGGQGLPDEWFAEFSRRVLETLDGTSYALQVGNEMPEKAMHHRIIDMLRGLGYTGEIVINRNEEGPGQPFNMGMRGAGGDRYDRHEFHVTTHDESYTAGYLDHVHPEEAEHGRPTTIRELLGRVDPSRIIISSDGDGGRIVPAQTALAREVLRLGASFERQSNLKRNRFFGDGSLRMSDLDAEVPFLTAIR